MGTIGWMSLPSKSMDIMGVDPRFITHVKGDDKSFAG